MIHEILEQYTIEVVSNRTRISKKNLEKLRDGNYKGFTKPMALGFLKILEREFKVDLTPMRKEVADYFNRVEPEAEERLVWEDHRQRGGWKVWSAILSGMVLLVLAGYFYLSMSTESHEKPPSNFKTTVETESADTAIRKSLSRDEDSGIAKEEKMSTEIPNVSDGMKEATSLERTTLLTDENESDAVQEEASQTMDKKKKNDKASGGSEVAMASVTVTPHRKLWMGIIDLTTKKRVAESTTRPFEIAPNGRFLVLTGHGRFEIVDGLGNRFAYDDVKRHYLLVEDGLVRPIDAATFKRLNEGRIW